MSRYNNLVLQSTLNEAITSGASGSAADLLALRAMGLRVGGAGALGGPFAAITTWAQMGIQELISDTDYTDIDYMAKGTRALVVGGLAATAGELGALGYIGYCTLAGTEVPGWGNLVGFGFGVVSYFVIDWAWGDDIEASARESLGELGCTGGSTQAQPEVGAGAGSYSEMYMGMCFAQGTRVALASGETQAIELLQPGDVVLAYDETSQHMQPAAITHTRAHPKTLCLQINTAAGLELRLTPNHPLWVQRDAVLAWLDAGQLIIGDCLHSLMPDRAVALDPIVTIQLAAELTPVFDISVADTHTFFAGQILAHNKPP
jgi:hypothetical protein